MQKIHFTKAKIKRIKDKAQTFSLEYLEECYTSNENEIDRCTRTNEILREVIGEKLMLRGTHDSPAGKN